MGNDSKNDEKHTWAALVAIALFSNPFVLLLPTIKESPLFQPPKIPRFCKETYYWSLRKVRLSLEGLGEEFEIMKIAFELEDLKKKDKEKRREKIGDFFLSGTDLGFRR